MGKNIPEDKLDQRVGAALLRRYRNNAEPRS